MNSKNNTGTRYGTFVVRSEQGTILCSSDTDRPIGVVRTDTIRRIVDGRTQDGTQRAPVLFSAKSEDRPPYKARGSGKVDGCSHYSAVDAATEGSSSALLAACWLL